jgi:hypothetical protein
MKKKAFFLPCLLCLSLTACFSDSSPPSVDNLRAFQLQDGPRRRVSAWYAYRQRVAGNILAYLKEESFLFEGEKKSKSYTVYDLDLNIQGQISSTGRVSRFKMDYLTHEWFREDLGHYPLLSAIVLLMDFDEEKLAEMELVPLQAIELLRGRGKEKLIVNP